LNAVGNMMETRYAAKQAPVNWDMNRRAPRNTLSAPRIVSDNVTYSGSDMMTE